MNKIKLVITYNFDRDKNVVSLLEGNTYLDRAGGNMAVMGQTSGEGWPIIEGEGRLAL